MEFDRTLSGSTPASEAALSAMLQNDFDDFGTSPADAGFGMLGSSFDGAEPFLGIDPSDTDPNSFMVRVVPRGSPCCHARTPLPRVCAGVV